MSIRAEPHFKIPSVALAEWLERQGVDRWWTVDGDPLLAGRLSFPCPADELAAELRRLNRTLLVQDRRESPSGRGQPVTARELDALVSRLGDNLVIREPRPPWANDRVFFLCWESGGDDWLLLEDEQTTESSRRDAALVQESK
jgi:hypothetical protein